MNGLLEAPLNFMKASFLPEEDLWRFGKGFKTPLRDRMDSSEKGSLNLRGTTATDYPP
jgi:hypothetical protein